MQIEIIRRISQLKMGAFQPLRFPLWPRRVSRIILITLWAPLTSHLSRVYCFRSEPCPSQLISDLYWLILTHTKLFFLLCLSIAVQMRGGECFRAYQAIFAQLPVPVWLSDNPPLRFAPKLGRAAGRRTGSCVLLPGPQDLLRTRSHGKCYQWSWFTQI